MTRTVIPESLAERGVGVPIKKVPLLANGCVSLNGKPTNEQLRAMELAIMEGPIPVVKPADEERLLQSDRELQEKLDDCPCRGKTNDGRPCSKDNPCGNCEVRRRYLALLLHRERYGRVKHPSEGYVNYVNSFDPPEDGV